MDQFEDIGGAEEDFRNDAYIYKTICQNEDIFALFQETLEKINDLTQRFANCPTNDSMDREIVKIIGNFNESVVAIKHMENSISIVGCLETASVKKMDITLLSYQVLLKACFMVYSTSKKYNSGLLISTKSNEIKDNIPFQQIILDFDVVDKKMEYDEECLRMRHKLIANVTRLVFDLLHIPFNKNNVSKYIQITSRINKCNFHLYITLHMDYITRMLIRHKVHQYLKTTDFKYALDEPTGITLPLGRNHLPLKMTHFSDSEIIFVHSPSFATKKYFFSLSPIDLLNFNVIHIKSNPDMEQLTYCFKTMHDIDNDYESDHDEMSLVASYSFDTNSYRIDADDLQVEYSHPLLKQLWKKGQIIYQNRACDLLCTISVSLLNEYFIFLSSLSNARISSMSENYDYYDNANVIDEFHQLPLKSTLVSDYIFPSETGIFKVANTSTNNIQEIIESFQNLPQHEDGINENLNIHFSQFNTYPFNKYQFEILEQVNERQSQIEMVLLEEKVYSTFISNLQNFDENYISILYFLYSCSYPELAIGKDINNALLSSKAIFYKKSGRNSNGEPTNKKIKQSIEQASNTESEQMQDLDLNFYISDYEWIKACCQILFNMGSVTSTLSIIFRCTNFSTLTDCINFILNTFTLNNHAKYILTKWALIASDANVFLINSFRYSDMMYCLFQHILMLKENKSFDYSNNERAHPNMLVLKFQNLFHENKILYGDNYQDFFFKYFLCMQSATSQRFFVFYERRYHAVHNDWFKQCAYTPGIKFDKYITDTCSLNFFTYNEEVGLFNPLFNVYEFAGPSLQSLIGFSVDPSVTKTLSHGRLSRRTWPIFQSKLFDTYVKTYHFINKCLHNVATVTLLCPIVQSVDCEEYTKRCPLIEYVDDTFIVLLDDMLQLQKQCIEKKMKYFDESFLSELINADPKNEFTFHMKKIILLLYMISKKCNFNLLNFNTFIQLFFGNGNIEQRGVPKSQTSTLQNIAVEKRNIDGDSEMSSYDIDNESTLTAAREYNGMVVATNKDEELMDRNTLFFKNILRLSHERENQYIKEKNEIVSEALKSASSDNMVHSSRVDFEIDSFYQVIREEFMATNKLDSIILPPIVNHNDYRLTQREILLLFIDFDNSHFNCELYNKAIASIDLSKQCTSVLIFATMFVSWIIRMGNAHYYANTLFFKHTFENANKIYQSLNMLLQKTHGPILHFSDIGETASLLKTYCENVQVDYKSLKSKYPDISTDLGVLSNNLDPIDPQEYKELYETHKLNPIENFEYEMDEKLWDTLEKPIYYAFSLMIYLSEFNFDHVMDLFKFLFYLLYKGNPLRICLFLTGATKSCKSYFANRCEELVKTGAAISFNATQLSKPPQNDLDPVVVPGAFNTLMVFDEVGSKVNTTRFKTLINSATMSSRDIQSNDCVNLKLECTLILTSNRTFSADEAVCSRLRIIKKYMQFGPTSSTVYDRYILNPNQERKAPTQIGAMITAKMIPEWNYQEITGLYVIQHFLLPFFFYTAKTPITDKSSNTMKKTMEYYKIGNYPLSNFLSSVEITSSKEFVSSKQLYEIVILWWTQNKGKFRYSDIDETILYNELQDHILIYKTVEKGITGYNISISFNK